MCGLETKPTVSASLILKQIQIPGRDQKTGNARKHNPRVIRNCISNMLVAGKYVELANKELRKPKAEIQNILT